MAEEIRPVTRALRIQLRVQNVQRDVPSAVRQALPAPKAHRRPHEARLQAATTSAPHSIAAQCNGLVQTVSDPVFASSVGQVVQPNIIIPAQGHPTLPDIIGSAAAATLLMSYAPLTHRSPKNAVVNQPAQPITAQSFEVSTSARSLLSVFGSTINDQAAAITTDNRNNIGTVDTNAGGGREMDTHFGFGEGSSTYSSPAPTNDSEHNGGIQNTISTNVDDLSEASTGGCSDTGTSGNDGDGNEAHMPADDIEAYAVIDLEEEEGYETDSEYNENVDINIDACDDISSDEDEEAVSADDELLEMSQNKTQIKAVKHSGWRYDTSSAQEYPVGAIPRGTFGQFMPRNRFDEIMRSLHFPNNNDTNAKNDRALLLEN
ncbi:hypothetical protein PC129_g8415 [Phytophthora cactorum]|uniref:Uncharacterized protein n=1 Tax=Phytophthora cactorum TaxID=29920 RepID=A0A8T1DG92_9STRA|nr:hypothetical protein PC112_g10289 [Phytophthora cactorum]KAG2833918.1 hypothetical protein PC111_g6035 [Phytophthora cactorum]KAG2857344.1 hypothetical protein PC113_g10761 [Phytophthora cactorum]KAG2905852.1 hypothetical protein PC114_g11386 [Phytophthora cactorum]KAG2939786.1 hypothetical protein PC115_g2916 [Phytophthora cactorum]